MTVLAWIVTKRRGCVRLTQDTAVGPVGPNGDPAVSHAVGELDREHGPVELLRKEVEQNLVTFAKEKEIKRRLVITISVHSGVSGRHGPSAPLLAEMGRGQELGLVTDLLSDFHLKSKL